MRTPLEELFVKVRNENRAALIAYLPAGFPTLQKCKDAIATLAAAGVDAIEIGFPYSDPVMDGATIQEAADISLKGGTGAVEVLETLKFAHEVGLPAVVMTYWNPIERYGVDAFAKAIVHNGGSGVITPDLTIEESSQWKRSTTEAGLNTIYVLAPSSTQDRIAAVSAECSGFVYAASLMGVTGARATISAGARELVSRIRATSNLPISVGLGVSTRDQARNVAGFADGVIVGSAFIKALLDAKSYEEGLAEISSLARQLAAGVREGR
ncbi:MAG: tryptophan synthase subunit alpha [Actinobacteria bacterium]|nr:tryptophan synthase subunit alpha [Actinomycetota bacterium]